MEYQKFIDQITGEATCQLGMGLGFRQIILDVSSKTLVWQQENSKSEEAAKSQEGKTDFTLIYSEYIGGGSHRNYIQRIAYVRTDNLLAMIKDLGLEYNLLFIFEGHPRLEGSTSEIKIEERFFNK